MLLHILILLMLSIASQSALSKDSDHDKKMATTSFATCELEDYSSATKPRDKAGALGMDLLKKLTLICIFPNMYYLKTKILKI